MNESTDIVEDLQMLAPGNPWLWVWLVALLLLVGSGGFFVVRLYRRKQLPFVNALIPPHKTALERLAQIRHLLVEGQHREFVMEVSHVIRFYIEERFGLDAPYLSTEEFLYQAESDANLQRSVQEQLKRFLLQCDRVKFARGHLQVSAMEELYEIAQQFVEQTMKAAPEMANV